MTGRMRCIDFLSHYSAFRDRVATDAALLRALDDHLAACGNCARYHDSVSRGVDLLKIHHDIEPSPDFRQRLRGRLTRQANAAVLPGPASVAAALMFASALTLGAYEISRGHGRTPVKIAAAPAPQPPAPMPYAAAPRLLPASDFTLAAFKRRAPRPPLEVVERNPVALGAWASLPR